ncbi:HD-GYP domain-containing protein [Moritella sp.]|uniref:HD-GYP domain-containing protein n=1 Tax=Moritella sp. TaxID=78556 RepID=UPI001E1A58BA|nr:HD-GYP domain-containing protein [Moritella sp.]MCJ8351405.1 HD-GYP domain-containing protein [Moritella sp.]NQZ40215.1 HD-GYP domain-containing protein [Moritella sp.]
MSGIKVSIDRIQVGNYVKLPLGWCDHPFMFNNFKIDSQEQLLLIRKLGVSHVTVYPQRSDNGLLPPQKPGTESPEPASNIDLEQIRCELWERKQQGIEKLKSHRRRITKTEKNFKSAMIQVRSVMSKLSSRPLNAIDEAEQLIGNMVDSLLKEEHIVLHLMSETKENENIYYHSLNVSVLAMLLARMKSLDASVIKSIGMGALFHDMGKLKIPPQILRKTTALTNAEQNFLNLHPKYGLDIVNLVDTFPESAKAIIAQHHELLDGSGYPKGLEGDDIDLFAQLVSVVNTYDTLCHPMDISKARVPSNALSWLYKNSANKYNQSDLKLLVKVVGVYPPGSVVRLSNDQIGMVLSVNTNRLLYPNILIYDAEVPRAEAPIIDLEQLELTITGVIKPDKLPERIYEYLNPRSRISYYFESTKDNG